MKSLKIKTTAYTYLPHLEFPQYFLNITQAVLSHPAVFQNLPVQPQALIDAGKAMQEKTANAVRGGQKERDSRDLQRTICETYLNKLGITVLLRASIEVTEEEQLAIIHLSKFTPVKLTRTRSSIPAELKVLGISAQPTGKQGGIQVKWKRIPSGIAFYEVLKAFTDPRNADTVWHHGGATSRSSIVLDGFPELTRCWVRVIAYGYDCAVSVPSNPVMCVAL